jgi:hypothetical protein
MQVSGGRMRMLCGAVMLVSVTSSVSYAQEPPMNAGLARPVQSDEVHRPPAGKVADKTFWLVGAALNTAMLLDTKSTFDVARRCPECYEANPVVAPFVNQGPTVAFTAGEVFDIGVMAVSAKMKGSTKPWVRHIWWVAPVAIATGHAMAYRHNVNLVR